MTTRTSVCALDCPDCCSLLVTIDNGRATKLRGNPEHPVTRGFLCAKVTKYLDREYAPDRLLYPQKRVSPKGPNAQFERITWDEALSTIADNLHRITREHGSEAILPYSYAGTMGLLNGAAMDRRFFHRLGASRLDRTICSSAGGAALTASYGSRYGIDPEAFAQSKFIIAWAANIHATNVHLWPFIVEARRRGAQLIVIDPLTTRTAALADKHFTIRPSTDGALALGLMHVILRDQLHDADYIARYTHGFDELKQLAAKYTPEHTSEVTGLPAKEIEWLARAYAQSQPAAIKLGYGIQRSEFGGAAVRAISALPVITGAWRHPGGGLQLTTSQAFPFNRTALERPDLAIAQLPSTPTTNRDRKGADRRNNLPRLVNMSTLGHALNELSDPPIHSLIVYNSNPAAVAPNQNAVLRGLAREDLFTVVLDHLQTDTADYADILLPATTFLEHTDLYYSWGHHHLQFARPVVEAPGEAKSNVEIFRQLAFHMGFEDNCFRETEDDLIRTALNSGHPHLESITLERLEREHSVRLNLGDTFLPYATGHFETASGKFEFGADSLEHRAPTESRGRDVSYPLEMISSKNHDSMNSTFGYRDSTDAETASIELNAADAELRKIQNGDRVRAFNDRGSLLLTAHVNGSVPPGVTRIPATRWAKRAEDRRSVNALTSERIADLGGGATFYNCLIEVERCGD